jgi:hypothetical protein
MIIQEKLSIQLSWVIKKNNLRRNHRLKAKIIWSGLNPETNYSFSLKVKDPSGNLSSKIYNYNVKTKKSNNTSCSGQLSNSQQGSFDIGFKYLFKTSGSDVTMEFELLDNKSDLIAYAWKQSPFW